jgi:S1-C subfamily serine protease/rhodanese-related sulfurtransferase
MLLTVKPAVVLVQTELAGTVQLTCPGGAPRRVAPPPTQERGTGFLLTPDGYLATNGHVVESYVAANEPALRAAAVRQAIAAACLAPGGAPAQQQRRVDALLPRVAPAAAVTLQKTLTVVLPNRERYVAEVKAYSPPLAPHPGKEAAPGAGATESGKDVAILKIEARNLPALRLGAPDRLQVGQRLYLLGFPGAVLDHDLLDPRSALEASVTAGRLSSVKRDARGAPVLQTDAAATWGNSGGPAVGEQGEVLGMLTFITLTADETQAIQGFNFLVPADSVREFARAAGADLTAPSPFTAVWGQAVARVAQGDWAGAQPLLDAAARLVPNLPDVQRLQTEVQLRLLQRPRGPSRALLGGAAVLGLLVAGGVGWGWRRWRRAPAPGRPPEPVRAAGPPAPARVTAAELHRHAAQRAALVLLDVREPAAYAQSAVQAQGARRAAAADVVPACAALAADHGIVLYCASPQEATSTGAAQRLLAAGHTRVAVLAGGFAAWEAAGLPLERTPHARQLAAPDGAPPPLDAAVDLPVGLHGAGPYCNGRAHRLRRTGVSLSSPQPLAAGQPVRVTLFLGADTLELPGRVLAASPPAEAGQPHQAEVAFEALGDEQAAALEGFLLAQRTMRRAPGQPVGEDRHSAG